MMKIAIILASALTLTACATGHKEYYAAVSAREARLAEQELRADTAIAQMAGSGDAQAKGMGLMYFALKANNVKQNQQSIAAPKTIAEQLLPWASIIVPSAVQIYGIGKNADVAINNSNNALEGKKADNSMITNLVIGREPVIGTADDVLLYPVTPAADVE